MESERVRVNNEGLDLSRSVEASIQRIVEATRPRLEDVVGELSDGTIVYDEAHIPRRDGEESLEAAIRRFTGDGRVRARQWVSFDAPISVSSSSTRHLDASTGLPYGVFPTLENASYPRHYGTGGPVNAAFEPTYTWIDKIKDCLPPHVVIPDENYEFKYGDWIAEGDRSSIPINLLMGLASDEILLISSLESSLHITTVGSYRDRRWRGRSLVMIPGVKCEDWYWLNPSIITPWDAIEYIANNK